MYASLGASAVEFLWMMLRGRRALDRMLDAYEEVAYRTTVTAIMTA